MKPLIPPLVKLLRTQHREIVNEINNISRAVARMPSADHSAQIQEILVSLGNRLTLHLVQEDHMLYPKLIQHSHVDISDLAKVFINEMGGIADDFELFLQRWSSGTEITSCWDDFLVDFSATKTVILDRIEREESQLFPLCSA